jgi:lipoprotein-releasing system permease protein
LYKALLILRYLRRKLAPIFALLAVGLCTAMVIIVISVMGGFLQMMRDATRRLSADLKIQADLTGLPDYEVLLQKVRAVSGVKEATPVMHTFGLINLQGDVLTAEIMGIRPVEADRVTRYGDTLMWTADDFVKSVDETFGVSDKAHQDPEAAKNLEKMRQAYAKYDVKAWGMTLEAPEVWNQTPEGKPGKSKASGGAVPGLHVSRRTFRDHKGQYHVLDSSISSRLSLTVMPLTQRGTLREPEVRDFVVVNEFKSGLYEIDANRVYVPFDVLQKMMRMDSYPEVDPETGQATGNMVSGRASYIMVRSENGVELSELRQLVSQEVRDFLKTRKDIPPVRVMTWRDQHATFLGAVEKEKGLLTSLFAFISLVAVVMIAVIFYMIVLEKTRDIGTLRALGASQAGIASIFLGYGLVIGVLGAALGLGIAASIVWNINQIQDFLGTKLGVTALYAGAIAASLVLLGIVGLVLVIWRGRVGMWFAWALPGAALLAAVGVTILLKSSETLGPKLNRSLSFVMWDPQVYYFDRVPSRLDPFEVTVILIIAVISSLLGSLVPAILAARLNPVESLRYE